MLVKKEMWRVYTHHITEAPEPFTVIWDSDKKEVLFYDIIDGHGDNWVTVDKDELFYESEEQAEAGRQHIIDDFLSQVNEIRAYCDMFYHSLEADEAACADVFEGLTLSDVFGWAGYSIKLSNKERVEYADMRYKVELLEDYIMTGRLCFGGTTFKAEDVKHVDWISNGSARLVMTDESVIYTRNEFEYSLTKVVFGRNNSRVTKDY